METFKMRLAHLLTVLILSLSVLAENESGLSEAELLEKMRNIQVPLPDAQHYYSSQNKQFTDQQSNNYAKSSLSFSKFKRAVKFEADKQATVSASLNVGPRPGTTDPPPTAPTGGTRDGGTENVKFYGTQQYPGPGGPGGFYPPPYTGVGGGGGMINGMGESGSSSAAASSSSPGNGGSFLGVGGGDVGKHGFGGNYPYGGGIGASGLGGYYPGGYMMYPGSGGYYNGGSGGYYPGFGMGGVGGGYPGGYGNYYRPNIGGGGLYGGGSPVGVVGYVPIVPAYYGGGFRKGDSTNNNNDENNENNISDSLSKNQKQVSKPTPPPKKVSSGSISFKSS